MTRATEGSMSAEPELRGTEPLGTTSAEPSLVRDLLRPDAYPSEIAGRVELRSTHASRVFLTEREVFKVKRPVDLGFLDFRTVEARRWACEEEVRLNRRLAPAVYLGLEPVRRAPDGRHRLRGQGRIVDWAVHMRRLPDEDSAAARLAAGRLHEQHLEALAGTIATFLAAAPPALEYGTLSMLRRNVHDNLVQSRLFSAPGDVVEPQTLELIEHHQQRELRVHSSRFIARAEEGRIREGHGDLRLEHVYFGSGNGGGDSPVVIDCVEFDERFRSGDVASEIAFLAMELELADRPDLAAGFAARSAEALDDFDLYGVFDFYLCYRAWVRAKVAAHVAHDPTVDHGVRARKTTEARRDFALARACAGRPVTLPWLIAVGGVIGSGKSTLAAGLGRAIAAPVISSDRARKALAGLASTDR